MTDAGGGEGPVVIAYDGSPAARQAVVEAAKILGSHRILVATVWEEALAFAAPLQPDVTMPTVDVNLALEARRVAHENAERVALEGAALARSLGLDAEPLALSDEGGVPRTILRMARERRAAAIVVGSRGLSGIRARLEGSTSKGLLKDASCPVIVVHEADEPRDQVKEDA